MFQESVMVPIGDWSKNRLRNFSKTDKIRDKSKVESDLMKISGIGKDVNMAYPTNVLHIATECGNRNHSAVFSERLPECFI